MAKPRLGVLPLLALLAVSGCVAQQYDYDYGYDGYDNFYGDEGLGDDGLGGGGGAGGMFGGEDDLYADEYGYYGDEDEQYYDYYGYYADGMNGYDDYYGDDDYETEECVMDNKTGKPVLGNHTAVCDIKISGVDKQADNLPGGLDGTYKLSGCHNSKAMYTRVNSPPGEERTLWYSHGFGDWDLSKGLEPDDADVLMYGGELEHASVPLFVSSWNLGADLKTGGSPSDSDFVPISVKVSCADGKKYDPAKYNNQQAQNTVHGPVLTNDELEQKYMQLYSQYARADPEPGVNFTFVVLLVMAGLTIVLAIPYFLMRKRGPGGKPASLGTSFAQMLQQSKKKHSGHIN